MKVIVVAPHPDDETLGCAGMLLKHKAQGDEIYWMIVTEADEALVKGFNKATRENEIKMIKDAYSFDEVFRLGFLSTTLDMEPLRNIIISIAEIFEDLKPNIVYAPFPGDVHTDHQVVFEAVSSATKNFRLPSIKKILAYETLSETDFSINPLTNNFRPNVFCNIDAVVEKKLEIASLYKNEIREAPFPRSLETIKALARYRGAATGCFFAEAFMLLKEIA